MSTFAGRAAALPRPLVAYDSDVEATGAGQQHTRAPRIHPALYAFAVISAAILFILSAAALEGYRPNAHFPGRHDELLVSPSGDHAGLGRCQQDKSAAPCHSGKEPKHVSASWNNIASVLGGFSTTYVTSPQLNTSWVARPGGLGARVEGQGLVGKMEYMKASRDEGEDPSIDRTGCRPDAALAPPKEGLPRIALIQRGECQFLTKLLNAQLQDFDAAIVYNDYEHSRRQSPPGDDHDFDGHRDEDELISMWSPAREAALLRIPSVFVSYRTGKILETLIAVEHDSGSDAIVIIEPEDTPHLSVSYPLTRLLSY